MPPRRSARTAAAAAKSTVAAVDDEPNATPAKKAKTAKPSVAAPRSTKKGLKGHSAPLTSVPLGVVDPASGLSGHILNRDDAVYDVMLSLVDLTKNSDKYYLLQVIVSPSGGHYVWARWGRTGTAGQSQTLKFEDEDEAIESFSEKYKEKTGCDWADHEDFEVKPGKYKLLRTDHAAIASKVPVMWQYYVDDGVDGKAAGWYDYDDEASQVVERLHDEWLYNQELAQRLVDSGNWTYNVDLKQMSQTNTSTKKARKIRRTVINFKGKGAAGSSAAPATPQPVAAAAAQTRKRGAAAAAAPAAPVSPPAKRGKAVAAAAPATPPATATKSRVTAANVSVTAAAHAAGTGAVDPACPHASIGCVEGEYDVMLNQVDIGSNKNKFYLAQLVNSGGHFYLWTRWGRVGESGQTQLQGPFGYSEGVSAFEKKFSAKTGNKFDDRANFIPKPGQYELITLQGKEEEEEDVKPAIKVKPQPSTGATGPVVCTLDAVTKGFVEFIFSGDMFKDAMANLELDVKKMPLGRLSAAQVRRGMDVLEELETELKGPKPNTQQLQLLSSKFYQVVPHSFGRKVPSVINSLQMVQQKYDLCNVLQDIEAAQDMMSAAEGGSLHPVDSKYAELQADLSTVSNISSEWQWINTYFTNTLARSYGKCSLRDVWRVDRHGDDARFGACDSLDNHKLLWHGTNVAVVAAILKSGLRIMPHSGGRVGRGIYLASESGKSIGYVQPGTGPGGQRLAVMFLVEAALGKEHGITRDDCSLTAAPAGYDSIVARGQQEPDAKEDITVKMGQHDVIVPTGTPKPVAQYKGSSFYNSEYLIYSEKQHRIRYVLTVKMP